jgi:hypothetical protein
LQIKDDLWGVGEWYFDYEKTIEIKRFIKFLEMCK